MNKTLAALIGSVVVVVAMIAWLIRSDAPRPSGDQQTSSDGAKRDPLILFCAASNRPVMDDVCAAYQKEFGREVHVQYGPSQTLLSSVEITETGDLFLPADDSYIDMALDRKLVDEVLPLALMQAVVAVRKGNPKNIQSFDDLLRKDVRLVQASPDAAAIGMLTRKTLTESGQWDELKQATAAFRTTVTDAANDLVVDAADAAIIYDVLLHTYPTLDAVTLPEIGPASANISIGVIHTTRRPQAALHFARFAAARDRGLTHYAEHGFTTRPGDVWSETPELTVFAGSMLRPAIDETITAFEQREGVRVSRVYNGCGILVAQMKAGQHPDAYFACDTEFMTQVPELFPSPVDVSQNELVILVPKGNPQNISSLKDLTKQGLRVGVGHEKQCAMGWLTQNTLKEGGLQKEVMENVTVQTPTGDMLVNQLRTGSLDAAVAYLSNAAGAGDVLDAVRIQGIECAVATQPFAISRETRYPQLTARLFQHLQSAASQEAFLMEGFQWQFGQPAKKLSPPVTSDVAPAASDVSPAATPSESAASTDSATPPASAAGASGS